MFNNDVKSQEANIWGYIHLKSGIQRHAFILPKPCRQTCISDMFMRIINIRTKIMVVLMSFIPFSRHSDPIVSDVSTYLMPRISWSAEFGTMTELTWYASVMEELNQSCFIQSDCEGMCLVQGLKRININITQDMGSLTFRRLTPCCHSSQV